SGAAGAGAFGQAESAMAAAASERWRRRRQEEEGRKETEGRRDARSKQCGGRAETKKQDRAENARNWTERQKPAFCLRGKELRNRWKATDGCAATKNDTIKTGNLTFMYCCVPGLYCNTLYSFLFPVVYGLSIFPDCTV